MNLTSINAGTNSMAVKEAPSRNETAGSIASLYTSTSQACASASSTSSSSSCGSSFSAIA